MEPKSPADSLAVMTQMILPSDANPLNAAFGGRILEWIDLCAGISAGRHCRHAVVTASISIELRNASIRVGWVVTLRARVLAAFRSSMEVGVRVTAENPLTGEHRLTTTALLTFVALDSDGTRATVPPLKLDTDAERAAFQAAHLRRQDRLERKGKVSEWQRLLEP